MWIRDPSELKFDLNVTESLFFRGSWIFLCEQIGQIQFFGWDLWPGGGFMGFQVASLVLFLCFWASPAVISKIPLSRGTNCQNKHRKTKLNNMAVILRVFILFPSVLTALNFDFSRASFINRYGHYRDGKPVVSSVIQKYQKTNAAIQKYCQRGLI